VPAERSPPGSMVSTGGRSTAFLANETGAPCPAAPTGRRRRSARQDAVRPLPGKVAKGHAQLFRSCEDGPVPDQARPAPRPAAGSGGVLSTVQRGLRALELIAAEDGLPTKEVARRLGLPPATAYHLVSTLVHEGYVWRMRDGGLILGDRLAGLLDHLEHRPNPFPELQPVLEDLARACGDVAVIGRLVGNQAFITSAAAAPGSAHGDHLRAGARGPIHTMALGKVLVAVLPPAAALGTIRNWAFEPLTEHTITQAHRFLDEWRSRGGAATPSTVRARRAFAALRRRS